MLDRIPHLLHRFLFQQDVISEAGVHEFLKSLIGAVHAEEIHGIRPGSFVFEPEIPAPLSSGAVSDDRQGFSRQEYMGGSNSLVFDIQAGTAQIVGHMFIAESDHRGHGFQHIVHAVVLFGVIPLAPSSSVKLIKGLSGHVDAGIQCGIAFDFKYLIFTGTHGREEAALFGEADFSFAFNPFILMIEHLQNTLAGGADITGDVSDNLPVKRFLRCLNQKERKKQNGKKRHRKQCMLFSVRISFFLPAALNPFDDREYQKQQNHENRRFG